MFENTEPSLNMTYVIDAVVVNHGQSSFHIPLGRGKTSKKEENAPITVFVYLQISTVFL